MGKRDKSASLPFPLKLGTGLKKEEKNFFLAHFSGAREEIFGSRFGNLDRPAFSDEIPAEARLSWQMGRQQRSSAGDPLRDGWPLQQHHSTGSKTGPRPFSRFHLYSGENFLLPLFPIHFSFPEPGNKSEEDNNSPDAQSHCDTNGKSFPYDL